MEFNSDEWETRGFIDDFYYVEFHKPCGTTVQVGQGHVPICPKCQPEEWAAMKAKEGFK